MELQNLNFTRRNTCFHIFKKSYKAHRLDGAQWGSGWKPGRSVPAIKFYIFLKLTA